MFSTPRARLSALAIVAALVLPVLAASPATATDAPRPPVADGPTPLTSAEADKAVERENARVVYDDEPELTSATTASVTGTLRVNNLNGTGPIAAASGESWVRFWRLNTVDNLWYWVRDVDTFGASGEFEATGLEPGDYRVEFVSYSSDFPVREYWDNEPYWIATDNLTLVALTSVSLGTITLQPTSLTSFRIAGDDRYETAVAISQEIIPPDESAAVVYLVTGANYADALSAGPAAAAAGGVMLLTPSLSLPSLVALELDRINPGRIVIVGGTSIVSSAVEQAVQQYVAEPSDVVRIFGANRYVTSRLIVADAFRGGVPNLFIATGRNFPDALAAGPAASRLGGAVLLIDGAQSTTDIATRTLITQLGLPNLHLAGGIGAITNGAQNSLAGHVDGAATVTRYAGANRYDTALAMNWAVFAEQGADFAYIATGAGFADALAGGPLAAAYDAPLYLSTKTCLRDDEYLDMVYLLVKEFYGLGGTGVLSDRVLFGLTC